MKRNKQRQNIIKAFNAAIERVIYTFTHERNTKIHYVIAVVVLLISLFLDLSRVEKMILFLSKIYKPKSIKIPLILDK